MTPRMYLFQTFVLAGAVLGLIIVLGLAVDPFGLFGTRIVPERLFPHNQNFRSGADRVRKAVELAGRRAPVDLLLVGSSRTFLGFNPASSQLSPLHAYNGGLGAGGLEEAARMVQFALTYHPEIQRVIWGIDSDRFLAGATDNPEVSDSPMTGMGLTTARLRQLLAVEPVGILFRAIGAMIVGRLKPDVQNDGRDITEARDRGASARFATFSSELAFYCRQTLLTAPSGRVPELDLSLLTQTLSTLKARGIDADVFIYPLHLRLMEAQFRAGGLDHLDEFKRRVVVALSAVGTAQGSGRIRLVDFNQVNSLTGEEVTPPGSAVDMMYYYEASHFKPAFGDAIVAELMDSRNRVDEKLGVELGKDTLDSVIAATRAAFLDWRATHGEDIDAVHRAGCQ
jgi:hypothetical protein